MPMRSYAYTRVPTCTSPAITASSSPSTTSTGSDSGKNTPERRIPQAFRWLPRVLTTAKPTACKALTVSFPEITGSVPLTPEYAPRSERRSGGTPLPVDCPRSTAQGLLSDSRAPLRRCGPGLRPRLQDSARRTSHPHGDNRRTEGPTQRPGSAGLPDAVSVRQPNKTISISLQAELVAFGQYALVTGPVSLSTDAATAAPGTD